MSIIKAGKYRFKDVLTNEYPRGEHYLNFTVFSYVAQLGTDVTADCFKINMLSDAGDIGFYFKSTVPDLSSYGMTYPNFFWVYDPKNGWSIDAYSDNIQTITIPFDQDVSDEFYEWFATNAKVYTTISGTWIIKDIPRFDNELLEYVNFISNGKTYLAFRLHTGSTQSEIFYAYSESGADQAYIDWYYDLEGNEVLYEWSNNAYKTIEFVGEQSVSQQFVDWLTANARNAAGIDFSTLKSLTIPEGVVTQIADASGRALWKQATVILRPTADISLAHSVYPAGSAGYACIDESVADGDATYIYSSSYTGSDFTLSGTIPDGMKVTSAKAVYVAKYKNISPDFTPVVVQIKIDGATYTTPLCYEISEKYERYERVFDRGVGEGSSVKPMYDAINALGSGDISLTVALNSIGEGSDKSTNLCITQLYIELTCEP